ncbi:ECF RNA polymerase sigma factor SigW [Symmachiella macrocystis]|uniref:RNA polymerase sigma factor n=1 Tax=Symmachiella macrocystis TaxID=2527985 RepID=A0A5C6AW14_9PLAN|nr:sigma-70 family RNA polymerase sigma factor [Symmachiella macrocystis]TWU04133.1 ECF RNA polymerase sigma factor SigW [Symmachiella macrocystis]
MKSIDPIDLYAATDAELIQLCGQGDQNAYGQVVERYQSLVCSVAYNRCGDLALSEDLAQDAFILAWQKLADLKEVSKFKAWICTIVRNLAHRSSQRLERGVTRVAHLDAVPDIPSIIETPSERAARAEEEKLVWQALADVPEKYREPLILFYREGQSVARVADALDLSEDAVKQRLSRGRNMLRQHLAAVVETVLSDSKPAKAFTGAVILGLSGATSNSAAAAGVTTATTTVAKSAIGAGVGSGLGGLLLWPILNLPVIAWLFKSAFDDARSVQERQLLHRNLFIGFCGFVVYAATLFSSLWWQQYIEPPLLRPYLPAALMIVFLIPWIVFSRQMGKRVERIRIEAGTFTPSRPLFESDNNGPITLKVCGIFCLSSLLVIAGPAVLPLIAHDWIVLWAMFATAIGISFIAAQVSLRLPKWSFQLFGVGTGLTAFVTILIMFWRRSVWASAFVDFIPWYLGTMTAVTMTQVILTTIAWKRVYGRRE